MHPFWGHFHSSQLLGGFIFWISPKYLEGDLFFGGLIFGFFFLKLAEGSYFWWGLIWGGVHLKQGMVGSSLPEKTNYL